MSINIEPKPKTARQKIDELRYDPVKILEYFTKAMDGDYPYSHSKSEAKRKAIMKGEDPVKAAKEFDKIKEKKSDGQTT